jgi:glycosyltransferase involved in cell wall biosynthesis
MRILQVCSARTLGGGERHVAALADALTQRGHEVYLAAAPQSPLVEKLSSIPAQNIITVRMRNALDIPSALKIAKFVRQKEIEIVHAHLARDYPLASLSIRRFAQLIVTRHVLFSLNRLHRLTLSRVARVIAVSKAVANRLLAQRICDERKIQVIPNGIELQKFEKPLSSNERQAVFDKLGLVGSHLVGSVGSLLPLKGHEEFIRAAAIVVRKERDVEFVIIGDDDERNRTHRDYLDRLIKELGLRERVHIVHWTDDLSLFYRALDVYVSASHSEAFGLSIVEAMASGRSVVATATEGAKEIIDDGKTGLLTPIGNAEKLAEAIVALLANEDERSRLGANAREDTKLRFSLEGMVSAVEKVYLEAIEGRK